MPALFVALAAVALLLAAGVLAAQLRRARQAGWSTVVACDEFRAAVAPALLALRRETDRTDAVWRDLEHRHGLGPDPR